MHTQNFYPLWQKWFDLHDLLSAKEQYSNKLAALFVGHVADDFADYPIKILYVGKATRGEVIPQSLVLKHKSSFKRKFDLHKNYLANWSTLQSGGFWPFADKLSKSMGCNTRSNLVWTNLCKIGMNAKNPSRKLIVAQKDLAVQTLRLEIETYKPSLIVFVTNNFAKEILMEAVGGQDLEFWSKSESEIPMQVEDIWWREKSSESPAILWMRHPQGAPIQQTDYAIAKACELTSGYHS